MTGCRVVSHVDHIEIVCAQGRAKVHLLAKVEIGIQVLNSRYRPPRVSCVLLRTLPVSCKALGKSVARVWFGV